MSVKTNSTKPTKKLRKPATPEVKETVAELKLDAANEPDIGGFMDPAAKKGTKRGRPTKEESERRKAEAATAEAPNVQAEIEKIKPLMRPLWETVSAVGVKLSETPEAAIGPNEMVVFVDCSAACVQQYLPGLLGEHANLIVLCTCFAQWSLRVYMLRQLQLEKLRRELKPLDDLAPKVAA